MRLFPIMPDAPLTTWARLLRDYMATRELSQSALAKELGVSTGIVSQWMTGAFPEHRSALRVARRTGLPERQVLEAAGLTVPPSASDKPTYPEFLTEHLDRLNQAELAAVAVTARELLRLREEKSPYEARPRGRGRPRKAPTESQPGQPRE